MNQPKSYTINAQNKTITVHRPMTENDLCLELLRDGYGDLVEPLKLKLSKESLQAIHDSAFAAPPPSNVNATGCKHERVDEEYILGSWSFCKHCHKEWTTDMGIQ